MPVRWRCAGKMNIPIVVFSIREKGNLATVLGGGGTATIVGATD